MHVFIMKNDTWKNTVRNSLFFPIEFAFILAFFPHFPQISRNDFLHNFQTTAIQILYSYDNKIRDYTCCLDNT